MNLLLAKVKYMICRLEPGEAIPDWLPEGFKSITQTDEELSIVCEQCLVENVLCERDWRLIKIAGPLDFSEIGILAKLSSHLAEAEISIFVISSFDTDYILIKDDKLAKAVSVLSKAGYRI